LKRNDNMETSVEQQEYHTTTRFRTCISSFSFPTPK
jgi:hypothetical protein